MVTFGQALANPDWNLQAIW